MIRSVDADSQNWAHGRYCAKSHIFNISGSTNSQTKVKIDSDGLKFGSDTAAANALDDYEEGTFQPVLENDGSTTYSDQTGRYVKIGSLVHVDAFVIISSEDNGATSTTGIENMPFANGSGLTVTFPIAGNNGWDANLVESNIIGWFPNGTTTARFYKNSGGNLNTISVNDIGSSGQIAVSITYRAA